MLSYSDFQEEFVKHYYRKIHNKQKSLSLEEVKEKILRKWNSYEPEQLLNFYIIYCLNKNINHIELADMGSRDWFSESMCIQFDEADEEESVKFCKECKKQFKKKTNPLSLKFRLQYIPDKEEEEELKTPKKEDVGKAQMQTAAKPDSAEKQEQKSNENKQKQKRNRGKKLKQIPKYEQDKWDHVMDSYELAMSKRNYKLDLSFELPAEKQEINSNKTKRIAKKSRALK